MEFKKLKTGDDAAPATLEKVVELLNALNDKLEASQHLLPADLRKNLHKMLLAVVRKEESSLCPDGVAFFVSADRAITPRHVIIDDSEEVKRKLPLRDIVGDTVFLASVDDLNDSETFGFIEMKVIDSDYDEDWATLQLVNKNDHEIVPFVVCSDANAFSNYWCVLLTMNIAFGGSSVNDPYKITTRETSINVFPKKITYGVQSFKGDSGGAIVVSKSGQVIGMRVDFVNKLSDSQQLKTMAALRAGIASGLRLDYLRKKNKI